MRWNLTLFEWIETNPRSPIYWILFVMKSSSCILQTTALQRVSFFNDQSLLTVFTWLCSLLSLNENLPRARAYERSVLNLSYLCLLTFFKHLVILLANIFYKAALVFDKLLKVSALLSFPLLPCVNIGCELAVLNLFLCLLFSHYLNLFILFLYKFFHLKMKDFLVTLMALWCLIRPLGVQ